MGVRHLPAVRLRWNRYRDADFLSYEVYYRERRAVFDAHEEVDAQLTGGVTDLVRGASNEGDGRDFPDDTVGVWPAATNLVDNGGVETDFGGWSWTTNNTIEASTEQAKFGGQSLKVNYVDSGVMARFVVSCGSAVPHVLSMFVYVPSDWGGGTLTMRASNWSGATGTLSAAVDLSVRDEWQRVVVGPFTPGVDLAGQMSLEAGGTSPDPGDAIYLDGLQLEAGYVATPYVETDGSTATRDAARLLVPSTLRAARGGVALRVKRVNWSSANPPGGGSGTPTFLDLRDGAADLHTLYYDESTSSWTFKRTTADGSGSATVADTLASGDGVTLVAAWDAANVYLSVDGSAFASAAIAAGEEFEATLADLGSLAGDDHAYADLAWAVFLDEVPTAAHVATLHGYGDDVPAPEDLRDVAEAVPTLIWDARDPEVALTVEHADWVNVASLDDAASPQYTYDRVASGQEYEFAVTVKANVFGDVLESDKQSPPVTGSVDLDAWYLQEVDGSRFAVLSANGVNVQPKQEISFVRPRGRVAPTAQIGEFEAHQLALSGVPRYHAAERGEWERVFDLVRRQRTSGAVLLLRAPHVPERYFVQVSPLQRSDDVPTYELRVDLQEVHYEETPA